MRTLLAVLLLLSSVTWYFVEQPASYHVVLRTLSAAYTAVWYRKSLTVLGTRILDEEKVRAALPLESSNVWWRTNLPAVEARLSLIPLLQKSEITPCSWWSLGCYRVVIEERAPAFVAIARDQSKAWVIGEDGAFMTPLTYEQYRQGALTIFGDLQDELVIVRGLWGENSSSDLVRNRVLSLSQALRVLREELTHKVRVVTLGEGRDMKVQFEGLPFEVTFQLYGEDIRDKASQLRAIIRELNGEYGNVQEIDLGFSSMAVMKLKQPLVLPKGKGTGTSIVR